MASEGRQQGVALSYGSDSKLLRSPCAVTLRDADLGVDYTSDGFVAALEADAHEIRITLRPLPGWLADAPIDGVDPSALGIEDAYVFQRDHVRLVARLKSGGVRIQHKVIGYPEYVAVTAAVDGPTLLDEVARLGYPTRDLGLTPAGWRAIVVASVVGIALSLAASVLTGYSLAPLVMAGLLLPVMLFAYSQTR